MANGSAEALLTSCLSDMAPLGSQLSLLSAFSLPLLESLQPMAYWPKYVLAFSFLICLRLRRYNVPLHLTKYDHDQIFPLLFVASIPTYFLNFKFFNHSSLFAF